MNWSSQQKTTKPFSKKNLRLSSIRNSMKLLIAAKAVGTGPRTRVFSAVGIPCRLCTWWLNFLRSASRSAHQTATYLAKFNLHTSKEQVLLHLSTGRGCDKFSKGNSFGAVWPKLEFDQYVNKGLLSDVEKYSLTDAL